jgi:hypothetical protein
VVLTLHLFRLLLVLLVLVGVQGPVGSPAAV